MAKITDINGEFDRAALEKLTWPIAWSGEPDREYEAALKALRDDGIAQIESTPDAVAVNVIAGEIVAVILADEAMTTTETKARYSLVKTDGGDYYVQETDADGDLVSLCDADGETVVEANGSSRLGNVEWTLVRDLGPVTDDGFFDAVAACPELSGVTS